jgi:hypothetical protein
MKKILLIMLFLASSICYSQNLEPQTMKFSYKGSLQYIADNPDFKTNKFVFTWQLIFYTT